MKALRIAGLVVAVVVAAVALLMMIGIPASFVGPMIQARIERETGYRVSLSGAMQVSLWSGLNVTINDVTLQAPNSEPGERLSIGSVQAELPLGSVLSGLPHITQLTVVRPVLSAPLLRDRTRPANPALTSAPAEAAKSIAIDRITVTDGAVVLSNPRDRVEQRIDGIGAVATISADKRIDLRGRARLGERPLKFTVKATAPATVQGRQTIPVELTLEAPDLLREPLTATADVRLNGTVLMINGLTGSIGDSQFNGWASADLASKPLLKLDLDFQRLEIGSPARGSSAPPASLAAGPWSDVRIDLSALNYLDAQIRLSAAQLNIGDARLAPAAVDASLSGGVLKANFTKLGIYSGEADGDVSVDVSGGAPNYTLRSDLAGVRALPMLSGLADFDKLDGKMQAKIAVRASGDNQRAILSSLNGIAFVNVQDGEIRGLNVAQMIRSLTASTISGWQQSGTQSTDLTQLSASFRIEKGQATTTDLTLVGPLVRLTGAGTVDLAAKALALRVEPKLVMSIEGQGARTDPVGLGIPVVIKGPWAAPQIYPDMQGILDNPDAAYTRLREMGKGLFGGGSVSGGSTAGPGTSDGLGSKLGDTLGALIQQGLGAGATRGPLPADNPPPSAPDAVPAPGEPSPMHGILKQLFGPPR